MVMEKRVAHHRLTDIQAQMVSVESMLLTLSAKQGIRKAGMAMEEALAVIQGLTGNDFWKSMTTHADHRVWQDVYHALWNGIPLYVKFQRHDDARRLYYLVSFKERDPW